MFGVIPYVDPKSFNNQYNINDQSQRYKLSKKSDIYSIGVIMWQISSGRQPFYAESIKYDISLALAIQGGEREKIIDGTPIEFSDMYTSKLFNRILKFFFLVNRAVQIIIFICFN